MMQKSNNSALRLAVGALLLTSAVGQAAAADTNSSGNIWTANHFGKDWGFSVGVKAWANEWDSPFELEGTSGEDGSRGSVIYSFESSTEIAAIPSFLLRHRNFFVGGSYLPQTDYTFASQIVDRGDTMARIDIAAERKEWDLNLGYFITPNLAVSIGHKSLDRTLFIANFNPDGSVLEDTWEISAPIIGLAAAAPVGKGVNLYGNVAYGYAEVDEQFGTLPLELEGDYYFGEVGLSYGIPLGGTLSALTLSAGYRFQRLDLRYTSIGAQQADPFPLGSAGDLNDSTHGFVISVAAAF